MRVALIGRRLEELLRIAPPPSSMMMPPLPTAEHGYRVTMGISGVAHTHTPPRVLKPVALKELSVRAELMATTRRLMLERPELHREHEHHHASPTLAAAYAYVHEADAPTPTLLLEAAPFDRWVVASSMPVIEDSIKGHQWWKQHRANDIRAMVNIEPRRW